MTSTLKVDNIAHTGGTIAQTIDSTGRILTPARPSIFLDFSTGATAAYEEVSNGAALPFRNKVSGVGITNDSSAFSITIPVSGLYQINMSVLGDSATEGIELGITVNGTASGNVIYKGYAEDARWCGINQAFEFSANDVLYVINNTGAARGLYRNQDATNRYTGWSTYLIG